MGSVGWLSSQVDALTSQGDVSEQAAQVADNAGSTHVSEQQVYHEAHVSSNGLSGAAPVNGAQASKSIFLDHLSALAGVPNKKPAPTHRLVGESAQASPTDAV